MARNYSFIYKFTKIGGVSIDVEVFVGDLSDPEFNYEKGNWNGNCPARISDFFPDSHQLFSSIVDKINNGEIEGKQTDWGSWTASMYPEQVIEIMREYYDDKKYSFDSYIRGIVLFLKSLPQDVKVGLVACEIS